MTMTNEEFAKWERLPHRVINDCFAWAFSDDPAVRRFRRAFDYDDLVQEANLALLDAWGLWESDRNVEFKTYAYSSIYRRVYRYVDANVSIITMSRQWRKSIDDPELRPAMDRAIWRIFYFSESMYRNQERREPPQISDASLEEFAYHIEEAEWVDTALQKLEDTLGPEDLELLLDYHSGMSYRKLGEVHGISWQAMRKRVLKLTEQCYFILKGGDRESTRQDADEIHPRPRPPLA